MEVRTHDRERHEGDCFYTIVIELRYWNMIHYPSAIYALIHILQKFPAGYYLCNNSLSNSSAIPT